MLCDAWRFGIGGDHGRCADGGDGEGLARLRIAGGWSGVVWFSQGLQSRIGSAVSGFRGFELNREGMGERMVETL